MLKIEKSHDQKQDFSQGSKPQLSELSFLTRVQPNHDQACEDKSLQTVKAETTLSLRNSANENSYRCLNGILANCVEKQNSLRRGCLLLSQHEAEQLNQILEKLLDTDAWRFQLFEDQSSADKGRKHQKRDRKNKSSTSQLNSKQKKSSTQQIREVDVKLFTRAQQRGQPNVLNNVTNVKRSARITQAQLKHLPDWAQRLHHVLVLSSQTETFRPFLHDISVDDPKYQKAYETIQPGLVPVGLHSIISKLEQNGYQCALDVFNDVYGVWLSSYRMHPPGSTQWLQTYQASRAFLQQIANQPVRDIMSVHPQNRYDTFCDDDSKTLQADVETRGRRLAGERATINVDQLLEEFLNKSAKESSENIEIHEVPLRRQSVSRLPAVRSKPHASQPPITDAEREIFQEYLMKLQAKHHLMLFEAFRKSAVWRSVDGGEVELDDTKTPPSIFRKMIAWCRSQLAVEQPLEKRLRLDMSGASSSFTSTTSSFNKPEPTNAEQASQIEAGSGKNHCSLIGGKGKVSADKVIGIQFTEASQASVSDSSSSEDDQSSFDADDQESGIRSSSFGDYNDETLSPLEIS